MRISVTNMFKIEKGRLIKGFTLVEIVVVIGIMALLTSIVYSSFDGAKAQSRDQQRITDISTIQLALEIYFNKNGTYPQSLNDLVNEKYIAQLPTPPSKADNSDYRYNYVPLAKTSGGTRCISYHLWTMFERENSNLESKKGFNSLPFENDNHIGLLTNPLYNCGTANYFPNRDASSESLIYDVMPQ